MREFNSSWNDGAAKRAITDFVARVTTQGGSDFVPPAERIAVFDNDGTLWAKQPMYFQLAFVLDRLKTLAPQHPGWRDQQPFKAVLEGDMKTVAEVGQRGMSGLAAATHSGVTTDEFTKIVTDWPAAARHPKFNRPYTEVVFQPMIDLMTYLRAHGFKTFIVSGGGVEFMCPWVERVYGIPRAGSRFVGHYQLSDRFGRKAGAHEGAQHRIRQRWPR
jgi:phosphoglycolate phosphatase-like HAD superfamily hydrolase